MATIKGWKFPIQVDEATGKIKTVEDNENIKQSIRVILGTQLHERKIVPNFGTDLRSYMFEVVDPTFVSTLKRSIQSSLEMWQEHIDELYVGVNASSGAVSKVEVNIDYITDLEPTQERFTQRIDSNEL